MTQPDPPDPTVGVVMPPSEEELRNQLSVLNSAPNRKYARFILAALSSTPWVGSVLAAGATLHGERDQSKVNAIIQSWLEEHGRKMDRLSRALGTCIARIEQITGKGVHQRVESEEFLGLVRKAFGVWDRSESEHKRVMIERLLTHAATTRLTSDDVVRMFLEWVERYHEAHFAVMAELYENPGSTRADIWEAIHGEFAREDSAEADLFKLLISDLSLGRVARQVRDTNEIGQFVRRRARPRRQVASHVLESAFEGTKPYALTELGKQFVHYVLTDSVPRIGSTPSPEVDIE